MMATLCRDKLLLLLIVVFILLSVTQYQDMSDKDEETVPDDYKAVLDYRVARLRHVCRQHRHQMAAEHSSLYHRQQRVNRCTTSYFTVKGKDHLICNVLKGGSTSWSFFFSQNNITATLMADCKPGECINTPELKIVQVRHPLERLLSTWRHLFKNGGWRSLDHTFRNFPQVQKKFESLYSNISWTYFVEEIVLHDRFHKTEEQMNDVEGAGVWIKHHWAPYWYTCGLCGQDLSPDLVLKTETLQFDIPAVLKELQFTEARQFPDIRTTGMDDNFLEGNKPSDAFIVKYFSRLTKTQVLLLYEMYRIDHSMFNYSPKKYMDIAK